MSITYDSKLFPYLRIKLSKNDRLNIDDIKNSKYLRINERLTQYDFFKIMNRLLHIHKKFKKKGDCGENVNQDSYILYRYIICSMNYNMDCLSNNYNEFMEHKSFYKKILKKLKTIKNCVTDLIDEIDNDVIKDDYNIFLNVLNNVDNFIGCVFVKINIEHN